MSKKVSYKTQNWSSYNQSLVNRGNINIWFSEDAIKKWFALPSDKKGRPKLYSDNCIELALTIRSLFQLPLRATQGFLQGLMSLLKIDLPVPHYSRLSRRAKDLNVQYRLQNIKDGVDLVIDSTGIKVFGEGEWKVRNYGKDRRRQWRKVHFAVDPNSFQIISMKFTHAYTNDGIVLPDLVKNIPKIKTAYADAAYISKACFDAIADKGGSALIDMRSGITVKNKNPSEGEKLRNKIIEELQKEGMHKEKWKKESGYHVRSLVETQMFRLKTILGRKMSFRNFENQVTEAKIKSLILNKMTALGMPITKAI